MTQNADWYQNKPEAYTALLFARIREHHEPDLVIPQFGQDAYENFQVAVYMRELLRVHQEAGYICWTPGFPYLYAALTVLFQSQKTISVSEIGSTLFATIDKVRKCEKTFGAFPTTSQLKFEGIDISSFFNEVALRMHSGEHLVFSDNYTKLLNPGVVSVGRCYQSSSYAFDSTDKLIDWTSNQTFSIQGAWFTVGGGDQIVDTLGKRTTLFDYPHFVAELEKRGHRVHHMQTERYTLQGVEFLSCWFLTEKFSAADFEKFCALCLSDPRLNAENIVLGKDQMNSAAMPVSIPFKGPHGGSDPDTSRKNLQYPHAFNFSSTAVEETFVAHMAQWGDTASAANAAPSWKRFIPWRKTLRTALRKLGI